MRTDLSVDLVLVRHAMPKIEPGAPAPSWRLGRAGRAAAAALGQFVPAGYLVSSDEPKALETAELVAAHSEPCNDVVVDRRLREVDRPNICRMTAPTGSRPVTTCRASRLRGGRHATTWLDVSAAPFRSMPCQRRRSECRSSLWAMG